MEKMQQILKQENGEDNPFKCAVCKHYLSISPIVHNDVLGSICGRDACKKLAASQGTNYRQKAYEGLAKVFEFPCKNEENGCKEVLPWNKVEEHELICEFVKLCCPFSTDQFEDEEKICTWEGNTTEILCHMEEVHSPHRFENYVQISLEKDIKKNKLFFSRILDSIVILLVVIGAELDTYYWKVWTVPEIWKTFSYKIEISSEKGQTLTVSKFQKAGLLLHPTFFKSKIDNSWFKINFDSIKSFFDFPYFLTTKFYVKGFLIGSPDNLSCDINSLLPMPTITCGNCKKQAKQFIYVCRTYKAHKSCGMCYDTRCPWCPTYSCLDKTIVPTMLKVLFKESFKYCILCKENVQCLSAHLSNCHNEFIFNLGEYNNFRLKTYYFSFDDHIFLLSKNINKNSDLTFSVRCLGSNTVKYKYELKLVTTKPSYSAITFTNFCYSELINYLNDTIGKNLDTSCFYETLIPGTLYNSIFPYVDIEDNIKFKLNIFKI